MSNATFEKVGECLYRNPSSGTYYALLKIRGKQIRSSLKTKILVEARRKLKKKREELESIDPEQGKITLDDLCKKYLLTIKNQSQSTIVGKSGVINRIKSEWPGGSNRLIQKIKPSEAKEFLAKYPGQSRHRQVLNVLRCMFDMAVADRMIAKSPVDGEKQRKPKKPIRSTPSYSEFNQIVESVRTQPFSDTAKESADFIEFLGLAGLGQAEAESLCWGDIDFKGKLMTTFRHKTTTGFVVPIYPQVLPLLKRRHEAAAAKNDGKDPSKDSRVFSIADPRIAMAAACKRLKFPNYTCRSLRRMFITAAIEKGVDVKVIASWQGHRDGGKLILDTYSHVRPTRSLEMAKLMTLPDEPPEKNEPGPVA
jgi:integrase